MYAYSADETNSVHVGIWSGVKQTDADYERALAAHALADRNAAARGIPYIHVLLVGPQVEQPPAIWRRRLSEANKALSAPRYYFAFVSSGVVMRGVFTAIRWLSGARSGHHSQAFSAFEEAHAWIREAPQLDCRQLEFHYARALRASRDSQTTNAASSF